MMLGERVLCVLSSPSLYTISYTFLLFVLLNLLNEENGTPNRLFPLYLVLRPNGTRTAILLAVSLCVAFTSVNFVCDTNVNMDKRLYKFGYNMAVETARLNGFLLFFPRIYHKKVRRLSHVSRINQLKSIFLIK